MSQMKTQIPEVIVEALSGHSKYLDEAYRRYSLDEMKEYYLKGMPSVMVFESTPDLTEVNKEIEDLKRENMELKKEMEMFFKFAKKVGMLDEWGKIYIRMNGFNMGIKEIPIISTTPRSTTPCRDLFYMMVFTLGAFCLRILHDRPRFPKNQYLIIFYFYINVQPKNF